MNKKLILLAFLATSAMVQGAIWKKSQDPQVTVAYRGMLGSVEMPITLRGFQENVAEVVGTDDPEALRFAHGQQVVTEVVYSQLRASSKTEDITIGVVAE